MVHKHGAIKLPLSKIQRRGGPVTTVTVNRLVWAEARKIVGADVQRITILDANTVIVRNR